MSKNALTGITAAALAAVATYFRQLSFPFALLLITMIMDYAAGVTKAWYKRKLSSKVGLRGIIKKLCYLFAVAVAVAVDFVIQLAAEQTSIDLTGCYFCALLVIIWLILNECISILENVASIGVPVPEFLLKLIKRLKQSTEPKESEDDKRA